MGSTLDANRLKNISVTGKGLDADLVEACIKASFSTSTSQVTEFSLTFLDTMDLQTFRSGILNSGATVKYGGWFMVSRVVSLASGPAGPELTVKAPSAFVEGFKSEIGGHSWGEQDVAAWVVAQGQRRGMVTVVQPGLGRRTIVRAASDGDNKESTWDVMAGLATATGCWLFEYGSVIVFARPSWLMKVDWGGRHWPFYWNHWADYSEGLQGMPAYTNDPGSNPAESLTLKLVSADADEARPGDRVTIEGAAVGSMAGEWIVVGVSYPMSVNGVVTLSCQRPIDPVIPPENTGTGTAGVVAKKPTVVSVATNKPSAGANTSGVDAWVARTKGRYVDTDGAYGAQCVDLVSLYNTQFVGGRALFGNGNQWYNNPAASASYIKVPPSQRAQKGDIACWGGVYGGGYGHVCIVIEDKGGSVYTLTQNPGPAHFETLTKSGLQGYLRPRKFA
ncbi:minor tail protein [Arthrobacter phage Colucci]|uniref:Minor tail protein n=1 Tax=Arthrobacter phage Colucci TaxID=2015834 RepID=A0A286N2T7_9CAUD|nr:endolysin [Arthrobacter phage Colucci]ASX98694.1 minor tail protein [Arthrobacter phage Colucci]